MIFRNLFNLFCALGLSFFSALAISAPWEARFFNPKPTDNDVILPLPCEGSIVFRRVHVPLSKPLDDFGVTLGSEGTALRYLEQSHPAHISGSFTTDKPNPGRYYLMAKYEVTELQYQSVMQESCLRPSVKLMLPKVELSWFEAMQFGDKLNIWLRANALKSLPVEDKVAGFVRLPTEVEWEFAARGGNSVSSTEFREATFPMPDGLNKYVWFAGSQSANGKLQLAGLLQPNPLGLHDMLGNADEMMFESFRLNKLDRFHGQAGGFIVRGANYMTPESDIRTSWRQEQTYYREASPNKQKTSGFRLVVVAPSLTSTGRSKEIEQGWAELGARENAPNASANAQGPATTSTVERLSNLMSGLKDDKLKKELETLRTELRTSNQTRDEQRGTAIRSALQQGAFMCVLLSQEGRFYDGLKKHYDGLCSKVETLSKEDQASCSKIKPNVDRRKAAQELALGLYSDSIVEAGAIYTVPMVSPEVVVKRQQFLARKSGNLDAFLDTYWAHLGQYLKDRKITQSEWLSACKKVTVN
ncbi:MAG: formylglycine-generating enzyme family protein [Burkholderiaceae bacterium]|nr:formylglycine-generating enzyme family protein [Burkholderiaceae bacterium]